VCIGDAKRTDLAWIRCSPLHELKLEKLRLSVRLAVKRIFEADKASKAACSFGMGRILSACHRRYMHRVYAAGFYLPLRRVKESRIFLAQRQRDFCY